MAAAVVVVDDGEIDELACVLGADVPRARLRALLDAHSGDVGAAANAHFDAPPAPAPRAPAPSAGGLPPQKIGAAAPHAQHQPYASRPVGAPSASGALAAATAGRARFWRALASRPQDALSSRERALARRRDGG